ncbi:MAG: hypothetical protein IPG93_10910 [Burkholderiales bacterium]|nr:hypothetical protein [Burkholderiales bacterium]
METTFKAGQVAPVQAAALPTVGAFIAGVDTPADRLTARTAQLSALMHTLTGEGFASFDTYSDTIRHDVLWLVCDLAAEVNALTDLVVCGPGKGIG